MKKALITSLCLICAFVARAEYLYWQIENTILQQYSNATYAQIYDNNGSEIGGADIFSATHTMLITQTPITGIASSYYVELLSNETGTWSTVAKSEEVTYDELKSYFFSQPVDIVATNVWHPASFSAVPEPTSGLLVLMGFAVLGLKRKKI